PPPGRGGARAPPTSSLASSSRGEFRGPSLRRATSPPPSRRRDHLADGIPLSRVRNARGRAFEIRMDVGPSTSSDDAPALRPRPLDRDDLPALLQLGEHGRQRPPIRVRDPLADLALRERSPSGEEREHMPTD